MSGSDRTRPGGVSASGPHRTEWAKQGADTKRAYNEAAKGQSQGQEQSASKGDKAKASLDREPSVAEKKQGAALDAQNASRTRFEQNRARNVQYNGRSRGLDYSR